MHVTTTATNDNSMDLAPIVANSCASVGVITLDGPKDILLPYLNGTVAAINHSKLRQVDHAHRRIGATKAQLRRGTWTSLLEWHFAGI